MKERFIKLPSDRARVWDGLSWFQRAVGSELFRAFEEREHMVGANWQKVVFGALVVPGEERGNVARALRKLVEAGVLIVGDGQLRLLYSERSFRAFHSGSGRVPLPVDPGSAQVPPGVQSGSSDVPLPVHSASSARNDSEQLSKRDRQKERETEREKENSEGEQAPLRSLSLDAEPANDRRARKPRKVDEAKAALKRAHKRAFSSASETTPVVADSHWAKVAPAVQEAVVKGLAQDLDVAADQLIAAARRTGKDFPWCLYDARPYGRQNGHAGAKPLRIAPATTGKDFADAESVEDQLARIERMEMS